MYALAEFGKVNERTSKSAATCGKVVWEEAKGGVEAFNAVGEVRK